jgi:Flp pilus assembly CpaE family ATPase
MKVKTALKIQHALDGKTIPSDMFDEHLVYYSKSKDVWINVMDMDVAHLVRAFRLVYDELNHMDGNSQRMKLFLEDVIKSMYEEKKKI